MISNTPPPQPESRPLSIVLVALFVILTAALAYGSANPDPYNADIVANFVSMVEGYGIPGNTFYLPAHSNASKLPQLWLAVQLFGYSNAAVAFTDFVDTVGLYLLTFLTLIWAFGRVGRMLDIVLACSYLVLLSAQWYVWIVHPGLRNIEIGAALVWVMVVFFSRRRWHLIAMVPLGVLLLIGDPWILTTFFVPAVLAVFVDTMNQINRVNHPPATAAQPPATPIPTASLPASLPASRWQTALAPWRDVARVVAVAAAVVGINYLLRRIANASGLFLILSTEQDLQVVTLEKFDHNIAITLQVLGQMFNMWVPGKPMIGLHVIRALGNIAIVLAGGLGLIIGVRSASVRLRRLSLFVLISCGLGLGLYVFSNFAIDATTGRYLVFLPIAVVFGLIVLLSDLYHSRNTWRYLLLPILVATTLLNSLVVGEWFQVVRDPNFRAPERQITQTLKTLQAEGATLGFAEYWQSLSYTMQLGKATLVAPVICANHKLVRYEWLSQRAWYEPALQPPVTKSFVIMDQITGMRIFEACTRDDVIAQFGPPEETRVVEYDQQIIAEVLIWNKNISSDLKP